MPLDYASSSTPIIRRGFAAAAALAAMLSGAVAAWCVAHAVYVEDRMEHALPAPSFFGTSCVASLGMPLEQTIPLGVLSSGCAMVLAIQSVRLVNGARGGGGLRKSEFAAE